jgi:hypothetical protein
MTSEAAMTACWVQLAGSARKERGPPAEEAQLGAGTGTRTELIPGVSGCGSGRGPLAGHPPLDVIAVPANGSSPESSFLRESSNQCQCRQKPAAATSKACDVVGGQDLIPRREGLIDPSGDRDGRLRRPGRDNDRLVRLRAHKRPMCGSGRSGTSCHSGASVTRDGAEVISCFIQNWGET